ncbi:hypothetical protein FCN45_10325 [Pantoea sp. SO10]|nr:hypothetical protein FCN45_10325 [Pantoea sp. SO10]
MRGTRRRFFCKDGLSVRALTHLPFSATRTEAYEQAGGAFVPAIRSAERSEEARRARRTRAKGGAGTRTSRLRRSVRQTNEVKVPRKRREDRRTKSAPGLRAHH